MDYNSPHSSQVRWPRGALMLAILRVISDGACGLADVCKAMSMPETGYGTSRTGMIYQNKRMQRERERRFYENKERRTVASLISQLKKQGMLKSSPTVSGWLTQRGKEKIGQLQNLLLQKKQYEKPPQGPLTIVIFDVPEKYRGYRDWIRLTLTRFGLRALQKSVFAGRVLIPEEFIQDLHGKNLLHYVHIFTITQKGSLESYVKRYIDGIVEYDI